MPIWYLLQPMADTENYSIPGHLVQELLDERGWTQRVLAIVLGVSETGLNKVLAGKQPVTAKLALGLGEVFDVPAERFLDLQKSYELAQARLLDRPDPARSTRAHLFGGLPISDMIARGWINAEGVRDTAAVERELTRFFGATSIQDIELLPHAAKKTHASSETSPPQLAWLYRVRQIADEMLVPRYSQAALQSAVKKLSKLLSAPELARDVPRVLMEAGVRFVIVETIPGAKIDGVCFWLDGAPVIGMTLRHDRIDNFFFVLRHEIEHALQGHGQDVVMLDAELEGVSAGSGDDITEEERIANLAAAEFCVDQNMLQAFIQRKSPLFPERDLLGFANTIGVHPGLVAGQLQHKTGKYNRFRQHQVKIRRHVCAGSIVDGWGDVAPVDDF